MTPDETPKEQPGSVGVRPDVDEIAKKMRRFAEESRAVIHGSFADSLIALCDAYEQLRRPSADEGMRGALKVSIHGEQIIGGIRFDQGAYLILKTSETPDDITF